MARGGWNGSGNALSVDAATHKTKKRRKKPSHKDKDSDDTTARGRSRIVDEDHAWQQDAPSQADLDRKWEDEAEPGIELSYINKRRCHA